MIDFVKGPLKASHMMLPDYLFLLVPTSNTSNTPISPRGKSRLHHSAGSLLDNYVVARLNESHHLFRLPRSSPLFL